MLRIPSIARPAVAALLALQPLCSAPIADERVYRLTAVEFPGWHSLHTLDRRGINDSGQVTGAGYPPGNGFGHAFYWTGATSVDLGTLGGWFSVGAAISASGQITGTARTIDGADRAFRWNGSSMVNLGTLGGTRSEGIAINRSGQVAGVAETAYSIGHAVLWEGTIATDLGTFGGTRSEARAINDSGQVVGQADLAGDVARHPFLWTGTAMVDLGTLGGRHGYATDINEVGQVTGVSETTTYESYRPFLWSGESMIALGDLGGGSSNAMDINNAGQVVGNSALVGQTEYRAVLWNGTSMVDLGTLGGTHAIANAINDTGYLTGESYTADDLDKHAFVSDGISLRDLNNLIDPSDPLSGIVTLRAGRGINNRGQVLAGGCTVGHGECATYVATPIPLIGPLVLSDINADGIGDIALVRDRPLRAEILSGESGTLLRTIRYFDESFIPLDAHPLPDSDGNGVAELAVLAVRRSDGRGVVEIRNVNGVQSGRQVWFAAGHDPLALAVITDDSDRNGIPEIAVLSARNRDRRGLVEIKNAYGATASRSIWVGSGLTPTKLEIVPDSDRNGVPEAAVLARRNSDGRVVVEVKNVAGSTNPNSLWFMNGVFPIDLTVLGDADGDAVPEVAVLSKRNRDGRMVVEVRNAAGLTNSRAFWLTEGNAAIAVKSVADADGNGIPEVAVLSRRKSDGRIAVDVLNAAGPTNTNQTWYPAGVRGLDLMVLPDLDGNGIHETGALLLRVTDGRIFVERRNASGPQAPRDYWFSP